MRYRDCQLADVTPRAAASTLLIIDRVLAEYESEGNPEVNPTERMVICDVLRLVAKRDCVVAAG